MYLQNQIYMRVFSFQLDLSSGGVIKVVGILTALRNDLAQFTHKLCGELMIMFNFEYGPFNLNQRTKDKFNMLLQKCTRYLEKQKQEKKDI